MANPSPWLAAATIATLPLIPKSILPVYRRTPTGVLSVFIGVHLVRQAKPD
jgi:hypothetical protein